MTASIHRKLGLLALGLMTLGVAQVSNAQVSNAQDANAAPFKRHTFDLRVNAGSIETDDQEVFNDLDDVDTAHAALGYWFGFNRNFSLGISYLDGESDDYEFSFFGLLSDSVLEYNAVIVGAEGRLPLGRRNFLFARLGAAFYEYDVVNDRTNNKLRSDDGTDIHFAAGWRNQWGSGVGMEVLYEFLPLGNDVEVSTVGVGITYSF